ncbi:MAG: hypothetical protein F7C32_01155 [Desulfurococcales archaeon]|nr:hypothetical protein [Desulfurococcales archaeon]
MADSILIAYLSKLTDPILFQKYKQLLASQGITLFVPRTSSTTCDIAVYPPPGTPLFEALTQQMKVVAKKILFASNIEEAIYNIVELVSGGCPSYTIGIDVGVLCAYAASCRGIIFDYNKIECRKIGQHMKEKWRNKSLTIYIGGSAPSKRIRETISSLRTAGYTNYTIVKEEGTTGKLPLRYSEIPIRDEDILSAISIIYRHIARRSW